MGDVQLLKNLCDLHNQIKAEIAKTIIGQDEAIEGLLISLLAGGHCLLVGVPGLAKTLIISSLAQILGLRFNRAQFTPDLMPADITGSEILQENTQAGRREFQFLEGPVFANLLLADEINRAPPKTQAALLEAMQESQVTVAGKMHSLPNPFVVLATQNPIEQEGTYPLPEAQLDRFLLQINMSYPKESEELQILMETTSDHNQPLQQLTSEERLLDLMQVVRRIPLTEQVARYAMSLSRNSRPTRLNSQNESVQGNESIHNFINEHVDWGAGPRGGQSIVMAAKARAAMRGETMVLNEDVTAVAKSVLRHRIKVNFHAETQSITSDDIVDHLIKHTRT